MSDVVEKRFFTWKLLRRVVFACVLLGVVACIALFLWLAALSRTLPSVKTLAEYNPPITSRVHAGDGSLIAEFAEEHRVFVPYDAIPEHVVQAFVSAEDKNFFKHGGIDPEGLARAVIAVTAPGRHRRGSSRGTICRVISRSPARRRVV